MEEELITTTDRSEREFTDNCGGYNCMDIKPDNYYRNLFIMEFYAMVLLGTLVIGFLITLGFYLVYKHKNDEHPRKHAIRRTWPWWIAIFLIPQIVSLILNILTH